MTNNKNKSTETEKEVVTPANAPTQLGHKNPSVGPTTGKVLPDWRKSRDYENFNPTPEK